MNREQEMQELKTRLKELTASQYRRFNVSLKKEAFKKLEQEAEKRGQSKAKTLGW